MNKIESLAIDTLTQFRTGVEKVKIGNVELTAKRCFEEARNPVLNRHGDEQGTITAIRFLIRDRLDKESLLSIKKLSVEKC